MTNVMDDSAVENNIESKPTLLPRINNPVKKPPRSSRRKSLNVHHDPEAQGSNKSPGYSDRAYYVRKFEEDIKERLQDLAGQKFPADRSNRKDWVDSAFKILQSKYIRRQHLQPDPSKTSSTFEGSITYILKPLANAPDTDPVQSQTTPLVLGDPTSIRNSLYQARDQWDSTNKSELADSNRPSAVRWIHLPANNMEWVESVMSSAMATCRTVNDNAFLKNADWDLLAKSVFQAEVWDDQCRQINDNPIFSRSMEPFATYINVHPENQSSHPSEDSVNVLVAFMPYLHWESSIAARYMRYVVEDVERLGFDQNHEGTMTVTEASLSRDMCQDEVLLRTYLSDGSLHPRRTLDQFHHHYLRDTKKRDYDQVVERYAVKGHFDEDTCFELEPPILMVDQCWVWAIGSDTVLTAFPRTWDCYDWHKDPLDLYKTIFVNIQMPIHHHYLESSSEFARFVIRISAINSLQPSKSFREQDKFLLYFRHAINELSQRETERLNSLWQSLRDQDSKENLDKVFDVRAEYTMLEEAQDIIEELQMIHELISDQDETMRQFAQAQRRFSRAEALQNNQTMQRRQNQRFKMLKRHSLVARRSLVNDLYQNAEKLKENIHKHLGFKQKQAYMSEGRLIRKLSEQAAQQGTTIMLFTTITIVFLPLSTLAAFFGINSKDLGSGSMDLRIIFAYIFPISTACVAFTLLIGLSHRVRSWIKILFVPFQFLLKHEKDRTTRRDVQNESSDEPAGLKSWSSAKRGPSRAMTGLKQISTFWDLDRQRSSTHYRKRQAQLTAPISGLAHLNSSAEQTKSILRRGDGKTNTFDRRRRYNRRNSRRTEKARRSGSDVDVAAYSLSSASDSLNDDSDTAEAELTGVDQIPQLTGALRVLAKRRGKLPI